LLSAGHGPPHELKKKYANQTEPRSEELSNLSPVRFVALNIGASLMIGSGDADVVRLGALLLKASSDCFGLQAAKTTTMAIESIKQVGLAFGGAVLGDGCVIIVV
jgi:hypothetical protein